MNMKEWFSFMVGRKPRHWAADDTYCRCPPLVKLRRTIYAEFDWAVCRIRSGSGIAYRVGTSAEGSQ